MNKLKEYREYIILIGISVILLLYIIFRTAGNMNYKLPETDVVDYKTINRITIEGSDVNLDFTKTDDSWFIQPENWQADSTNLIAIAKAMGDLNIADLISTSNNPEIYNLDESNRIKVSVYKDNDLLREIFVGKVSATGIYTYIQLPGDDNVYSVRGNLPSRVKDKKSMRDKKFVSIPRDSIQKMTLRTNGGDTKTVIKSTEDDNWSSKDFEAVSDDIKSAVNVLDPLRCKDFIYDDVSDAAKWTIDILTNDGTTSLKIWPKTEDNSYIAQYSVNGYFVDTASYSIEKLLKAFGLTFDK
ncbi:MAG: DUF4340 domain-containing protein, partial [Spirochaetales bacterium]|nr:DUF4340 domain-containing protein [Spirochaetales bacterium]